MKTVFVICPTGRDYREINRTLLCKKYNVLFHSWDKISFDQLILPDKTAGIVGPEPSVHIAELIKFCTDQKADAVVSSDDYPGSILASFVAKECDLIASHPETVLTCHHKYYARCAQARNIPDSTPSFMLLNAHGKSAGSCCVAFPFFIKPVKSSFSVYARQINSADELKHYVAYAQLPDTYLSYFNYGLKQFASFEYDGHHFLAEDILEGFQVTVEGFVYNGVITVLGIVDSIMFPGTISFARFEYPSRLPTSVQECIKTMVKQVIVGVGLDNTMFNVECIYNQQTGAIHIIEINSRISSQFADLFEKVDGTNSYEIMFDLALGNQPAVSFRQGSYGVAASCVLRLFEDNHVVSLPSKIQLDKVLELFPDIQIELCAQEGKKLSSVKQDEYSYRYGLINLGGHDWEDLFAKYHRCLDMLEFVFEPL